MSSPVRTPTTASQNGSPASRASQRTPQREQSSQGKQSHKRAKALKTTFKQSWLLY